MPFHHNQLTLVQKKSSTPPSHLYYEDFESYTIGDALTVADFTAAYQDSGSATVQSGFGGKVARLAANDTWSWAHAIYDGKTFGYTDVSARIMNTGKVSSLLARVYDLNGGASFPSTGYIAQIMDSCSLTLTKWPYTLLGTGSVSIANPNDFILRFLCDGDQLSIYVDGLLVMGPITDATYSSGKIGFGAYITSTAYDNLTVN